MAWGPVVPVNFVGGGCASTCGGGTGIGGCWEWAEDGRSDGNY